MTARHAALLGAALVALYFAARPAFRELPRDDFGDSFPVGQGRMYHLPPASREHAEAAARVLDKANFFRSPESCAQLRLSSSGFALHVPVREGREDHPALREQFRLAESALSLELGRPVAVVVCDRRFRAVR